MTLFFSSHDLTIYRHRRIGAHNRFSMSVTLTVVPSDIQPSTPERTAAADGRYGQVWDAYVDSSIDIKEGDQVVDVSTSKRYSVKGVVLWDGAGLLSHKELTLMSMDGNDE